MKEFSVRRIVQDINIVSAAINHLWEARPLPWRVFSDSEHMTENLAALRRIIRWMLLNQPPAEALRGYHAAERLDVALSHLTATEERELQRQLTFAALVVVRTLRQQPSGWWIRGPIKEWYAA